MSPPTRQALPRCCRPARIAWPKPIRIPRPCRPCCEACKKPERTGIFAIIYAPSRRSWRSICCSLTRGRKQALYAGQKHRQLRSVDFIAGLESWPYHCAASPTFPSYALLRTLRWCGLLLDAFQLGIETGPFGCADRPDVHRGRHGRGVVERAHPDDGELRSCRRVAEQLRAATGAKPSRDRPAARCNHRKVGELAGNLQIRARHQCVDGAIGGHPLTVSAPADSGGEGLGREPIGDCATQTTSFSFAHVFTSSSYFALIQFLGLFLPAWTPDTGYGLA
jgi:hypothetical protein